MKILNVPLDRIVVEPVSAKKQTESGIFIPDNVQQRPMTGTVLFAGEGTPNEPPTTQVGNIIMFRPNTGTEFELEGKKLLIMKYSDVLLNIGE